MTPEQKAADAMGRYQLAIVTYIAGQDGWAWSQLTDQYVSYASWLQDTCAHHPAFKAVVDARATHPDAVRAAFVRYYQSIEPPPPPPPKPPTDNTSPGIPWGQVGRETEMVLKAIADTDNHLHTIAKALGVALSLLLLVGVAQAQVVNFQWDSHEEAAQITGFRLYQTKQANVYADPPVATFVGGTLTTGQIPQPSLGRYYFVLTAYKDDAGYILESAWSNEVSLVLKPKPPRLQSVVQAIAMVPVRGVQMLAGLFRDRNLRIK